MSDEPKSEDFKGDDLFADESLLKAVYPEMRRLAFRLLRSERPSHTLQPTVLANEALLRLLKPSKTHFENRAQFYAIASNMMRQILVDHARSKMAAKRGSASETISLDKIEISSDPDLIALEIGEALSELEKVDPRAARVVEMRFFAGLTDSEIAEVLGSSVNTIKREWHFARAWLYNFLAHNSG